MSLVGDVDTKAVRERRLVVPTTNVRHNRVFRLADDVNRVATVQTAFVDLTHSLPDHAWHRDDRTEKVPCISLKQRWRNVVDESQFIELIHLNDFHEHEDASPRRRKYAAH